MRKIILGIITAILFLAAVISVGYKEHVRVDVPVKYSYSDVAGVINNKSNISYTFTPKYDINGLKFLVGTYGEYIQDGHLKVELYDAETDEMIGKAAIAVKALRDNEFAEVYFGEGIKTKGKKVRVLFWAVKLKKNKGVTIWMGKNSLDKDAVTKYKNKTLDQNLIVIPTYLQTQGNLYSWELFLLASIMLFATIIVPNKGKQTEEEEPEEKPEEEPEDKSEEESEKESEEESEEESEKESEEKSEEESEGESEGKSEEEAEGEAEEESEGESEEEFEEDDIDEELEKEINLAAEEMIKNQEDLADE